MHCKYWWFFALFCFFINWRFVVTLCEACLLTPFSQQHLLTLCLCHILVILPKFQTLHQKKKKKRLLAYWRLRLWLAYLTIKYFHKACKFFRCNAIAQLMDYAAKSLQSCPTLCNPIDGSPPGSAVPGILQARTLEWVAISFPNAWQWKVKVKCSVVSDS